MSTDPATAPMDGGPAFPTAYEWHNASESNAIAPDGSVCPPDGMVSIRFHGLTVRDYFAAKAMQSLLLEEDPDLDEIGLNAYAIADVMLEARNESKDPA